MEFVEWKKQVEGDYKKRVDEKEIRLSRKEDGNIIGYLDTMCKEHSFLQSIYEKFHNKYEECKSGDRTAGEKTIKMLFIKAVIQDKIRIEKQKDIAVEIDKTWIERETHAQDGIYDNVCRNGYFPMGSSSGEIWIDFCSAFHRLMPNLFNSWDKVNEFCVKCCENENGDNFLYVRKLQDLCTYYTICQNRSAQYRDEIYAMVAEKVKKIKEGKNRKDNPENAVTATNRMMQEIGSDSVLKNKDSFLNFVLNNAKNFLEEDEEFVHISAIKMLYGTFYPNEFYEEDLVLDNGQYRNYRDYVDKLGKFYLNEIFNRAELESVIKYCKHNERKLKALLLDKIVPNFTGLQDGVIANAENLFDIIEVALGDVIRIENEWRQKEAVAEKQGASNLEIALIKDKLGDAEIRSDVAYRERSTKGVISRFNVSLRYLSIIAAMWKMKEDSDTYNAEDAVIAINDILNDCSLRYLETNHMCDDFDWFIYEALKCEEKMCEEGKRNSVSGIDTLTQYLCEE